MTVPTIQVVLDCQDLDVAEAFWTAALGYRRTGSVGEYVALRPPEGESGPKLILQRVPESKTVKNRMHLDWVVEDAEEEAERVEALGATRDARVEENGMVWIRMRDPEGNEFCIEQA